MLTESAFCRAYAKGYNGGFEHGALHGKFEGRGLGSEKGFDIWGEVGYYEGMATMWRRLLSEGTPENDRSRKQSKQYQQITALLSLIHAFPTDNAAAAAQDDSEADLMQLLQRIRAKYKSTAATLGFQQPDAQAGGPLKLPTDATQMAEIRGQLVDTNQLRY